jgi:FkbM family methyltransferase
MKNYYNVVLNKTNIKVKKILEIGSRDGNDANFLKKLFNLNDEDVWVVEPNPIKIKEIKEKYPKINLVEFAISNTEGEHTFNQVVGDDISAGTSSLIDRADDWYEKTKTNKIIVNTIRGEKLLEIIKEEIDVCKIDVEGFTYEVLESFDKKLSNIKSLHVECEHKEVWKTQKLYEEIKDFLNKKNFVEVYFSFTSEHKLQSDSIWVYKDYLKI